MGLLTWASVAWAGSGSESAANEAGQVGGALESGGEAAGNNLPFTGLNLALIIIGGVLLLTLGLGLRKLGRGKA
jgi:hypothetical protein